MKPELLSPAGNVEAFHAALEAGADAIYLGLDQFNARNRAKNFKIHQLPQLLKMAHQKNTQIYVTLNTLIKNKEIAPLLDFLHALREVEVDAVIIQDWGIYYLLERFFPQIGVHASTQMANHNSAGAEYAYRKSFDRIIMARELTYNEIQSISTNSEIEIEVFTHGALCYAFSGHCLFSSYLGGMSANRGLCKQPCRRKYKTEDGTSNYLFSLKDLQLIDYVPKFSKLGISSLKIEGRMKSAEYVYRVIKAYRMVIDDPATLPQAKLMLESDFAREKTGYFVSQSVKESLSQSPFTGKEVGIVEAVTPEGFIFTPKEKLVKGDRIRVMPSSGEDATAIKLNDFKEIKDRTQVNVANPIFVPAPIEKIIEGNRIFHTGSKSMRFPDKLPKSKPTKIKRLPEPLKKKIFNQLYRSPRKYQKQLFVRINDLQWMRKLHFNSFDYLIINLSVREWKAITLSEKFLRANINKLVFELPLFIAEDDLTFYQERCYEFFKQGVQNFMINHVSQKILLPANKKIRILASEHIYTLNDAAVKFLASEDINHYIYPYENEMENYYAAKHKNGIVPLYFYPKLFHSRMPIGVDQESVIKDIDQEYITKVRDGFTTIIPKIPVSALQYREKLEKQGFTQFLLDLSYEKVSSNTIKRLLKKYQQSDAERPSSGFNVKKGLR